MFTYGGFDADQVRYAAGQDIAEHAEARAEHASWARIATPAPCAAANRTAGVDGNRWPRPV